MSEEENTHMEKIELLIQAALTLNEAGEYRKSEELGLLALELNPDYPTTNVLLGLTNQGLKQDSEAERYFSRALELEPENEDALHSLGLLLLSQGKKVEGVVYLTKYFHSGNWDDTESVIVNVKALDELERQGEATEILSECWEKNPSPEIGKNLFKRLLSSGMIDDAIRVLREVANLTEEPDDYLNLATHEMSLEKYQNAISSLEEAYLLEDRQVLVEPGFSYKEYLEAGESWPEEGWPDDEKLSVYDYLISFCYLRLEEGDKALAVIEGSIKVHPFTDPSDYSIKAQALVSLGRYDEAIEAADFGIKYLSDDMDKLSIELYQYKATSLEKLGQIDEAITIHRELIERYPQNIDLYQRLVSIYLGQKNFKDAIAISEEALRKANIKTIGDMLFFNAYLTYLREGGISKIPNEVIQSFIGNLSEQAGEYIIDTLSYNFDNFPHQVIEEVSWNIYNRFQNNPKIANVYAIVKNIDNEYQEAISVIDSSINNSRNNLEIKALMNNKAYNQLLLGSLKEAEETLLQLLSINVDQDTDDQYLMQCISFYKDQKIRKEYDISHRKLNPDISAKVNLATLSLVKENHEIAFSIALEIIDEKCDDSLGFELLGYCYMASGEDQLAKVALTSALNKITNNDIQNIIQSTLEQIGIEEAG